MNSQQQESALTEFFTPTTCPENNDLITNSTQNGTCKRMADARRVSFVDVAVCNAFVTKEAVFYLVGEGCVGG
jgi:hypothetical protein